MAQDFDWKKIVGTLAPAAATAFGTPVMGAAVAMLTNAIFPDASNKTVDDVVDAMANGRLTGEQIAAVKKADNDFKVQMGQQGIDLRKIEADTDAAYLRDVQDARARQVATKDNMPQLIFFILLGAWGLCFITFMRGGMPSDDFTRGLITTAFGTINTGLVGAIAYFIGSSKGSKTSGDSLRRIAEMPAPPPVVVNPPSRVMENPAIIKPD